MRSPRRTGARGRRWLALPVGVAVVLTGAAAATGDTTTRSDPKNDVRGVPKGEGVDLSSVAAAHGGSGEVVHRISSHYAERVGFNFVRVELNTGLRVGLRLLRQEGRARRGHLQRAQRQARRSGAVQAHLRQDDQPVLQAVGVRQPAALPVAGAHARPGR